MDCNFIVKKEHNQWLLVICDSLVISCNVGPFI